MLAFHHIEVYGQALMNKLGWCWPKQVPGSEIKEYMIFRNIQTMHWWKGFPYAQSEGQQLNNKIMSYCL